MEKMHDWKWYTKDKLSPVISAIAKKVPAKEKPITYR